MADAALDAVARARRALELSAGGPPPARAQALEALATALIESGDLAGGARALDDAARAWGGVEPPPKARDGKDGSPPAPDGPQPADREGACRLLAAATWRLAGDGDAAADALRRAQARSPAWSPQLQRGVALEACEQALAAGRAAEAVQAFSDFLQRHGAALSPTERVLVLQRRAAAATAAAQWSLAGADFLEASLGLASVGTAADVEAAQLAAASALLQVDAAAAEALVLQVLATVPADGGAALRRGLVAAEVAQRLGDPALALRRLDAARQGALDADDPLSYAGAALQAARVAEQSGDADGAYARLATAWGTLTARLGREAAAGLVRPALLGLRERLTPPVFEAAKQRYEAQRRAAQGPRQD